MRDFLKWSWVGSSVVAVVLSAGCQSASPSSEPGSDAGTVLATEPAEATEPETAEPAPPADTEPAQAQAAQEWPMPDLVGATLQDAQDQIQALTNGAVFFSASHDLSGQDRNQVLDANWEVCTQNIAAGTPIDAGSQIDFGVVKIGEGCP